MYNLDNVDILIWGPIFSAIWKLSKIVFEVKGENWIVDEKKKSYCEKVLWINF